jgi:hypothetical protein
VTLCPVSQCLADEFRAVIHSQPLGLASQFDELIQSPNHSGRRQAGVDWDAQSLLVVVIHHYEGPDVLNSMSITRLLWDWGDRIMVISRGVNAPSVRRDSPIDLLVSLKMQTHEQLSS